MMRPIGHFLAEFRLDGSSPAPFAPIVLPFSGAESEPELLALDPFIDEAPGSALLEDVSVRGAHETEPSTAAASEEPLLDLASALATRDAEHAAALSAARAHWAAAESAVLADRMGQAFADLEHHMSEALATVLEPFLNKAAQQKALGQLRDLLGTLLGSAETPAISVAGPADLLLVLRESYGDRPGLAFTESDAPDITVAVGDTRVRSQLRAFTRRLEAALGAPA